MSKVIEFFKTVALSVYPLSYHEFSQKSFGQVLGYFFWLVFCGLILTNLLLIPFYIGVPDVVFDSVSKFTSFDVSNDVEMSSPIEIPKREALFVIDTTGTIKEIKQERMIITKDHVYYRPFFKNKRVSLDKLLDVVNHPNDTTWMLIGAILLFTPSLLLYTYMFIALKYFILIFLSSFLLYFIVRVLMLYKISFKNALNCAFYAGSLMILIEALVFPLNASLLVPVFNVLGLNFYVVSYAFFLVFGIMGMVIVEKDLHIGKKSKKKSKEEEE